MTEKLEEFLLSEKFDFYCNNLIKFLSDKKIILYNTKNLELLSLVIDFSKLNILGISDINFSYPDFGKKYKKFTIIPIDEIKVSGADCVLILDYDRFLPLIELRDILLEQTIQVISIFADVSKPILNYLETHVAHNCNLNCKSCAVYSPISFEQSVDIRCFENDLKELSKKVHIECLRLMGGEPLLHNEIVKFLLIAREIFPLSDIHIVTNGILLPKMKDEFWEVCRKNKIKIDLSVYPSTEEKQSYYVDLVSKNNVEIGFISPGFYFFNTSLSFKAIEDAHKSYDSCWQKLCTNLRDGHLSICATACYVDYLNKYFNVELPEDKGIDIYKNTGEEIVNYLKKPVELCSHCNLKRRDNFPQPWEYSKKEMSEWLP